MDHATRNHTLRDRGGSIANLKEHNLSQILQALARGGPMPRAEIAARCGLQVTALTNLVAELRRRGLVDELLEPLPSGRGRPTYPVTLAATPVCVLAFECNRNHVVAAIGTLRGEVLHRERYPIDGPPGWETYRPQLALVVTAVAGTSAACGLRPLSAQFSIPGAVDHHAGQVIRSVLNEWGRVHFRDETHGMLRTSGLDHPVVGVDRETNYAMLSRVAVTGAPAVAPPIAYIGGTVAISGGIYGPHGVDHGATGLAGEVGHLIVDPHGRRCWCGRRGCVETRMGLLAVYAAATGGVEPPFDRLVKDARLLVETIRRLADRGDARARAALDDVGHWLGITIDMVASLLNPTLVVIDGYLGYLSEYVEPAMRRYLDPVGSLPALASLSIEFPASDDDTTLTGMLLAGRDAIIARPSIALP